MTSTARRAIAHSSIYAIGNITRQLAGFIMLPVYTRHLSPSDYGVVGMLLAVLALVEVCFGARLAHAMPKFYFDETEDSRKKAVISTSFLITGVPSFLAMCVLIAMREQSSQTLFNSADFANVIGLFSVLLLTQALEYYGMSYIRMQQRPWLFISISLMKLVVQLSLNIWLVVYEQMGVFGVAIGSAASSILFAAGLSLYTLSITGISINRELAIRMIKFNWPLWIGGLASLYIGSANRYFINFFSSTADVGLFELAAKFSGILILVIWDPFNQHWSNESFRVYKNPNATTTYQSTFQVISTLLVIGSLGIALFSDPTIRIMAAPAFHAASLAIPFLTAAYMFSSLALFSSFSFLIQEKTLWMTLSTYITAAILTVMFLLLVPTWGYVGAAVAGLTAAVAQFLIVHHKGRKIYDMNIQLRPFFCQIAILVITIGAARLAIHESLLTSIFIDAGLFIAGSLATIAILLRQESTRQQLAALVPQKFRYNFFN